jgi:hypothetical protein
VAGRTSGSTAGGRRTRRVAGDASGMPRGFPVWFRLHDSRHGGSSPRDLAYRNCGMDVVGRSWVAAALAARGSPEYVSVWSV